MEVNVSTIQLEDNFYLFPRLPDDFRNVMVRDSNYSRLAGERNKKMHMDSAHRSQTLVEGTFSWIRKNELGYISFKTPISSSTNAYGREYSSEKL
jgi:hypothetical protein